MFVDNNIEYDYFFFDKYCVVFVIINGSEIIVVFDGEFYCFEIFYRVNVNFWLM